MALLSKEIFGAIVRHTPLVSIDLILRDPEVRLLVGRRRNRPAMETWFVPGGRIAKDERIAEAFARITRDELGIQSPMRAAKFLGVFEHFYPDNAFDEAGFGTHYVVLAYEISVESDIAAFPRDQHSAYRWISDADALADPQVHENTKAYCRRVAR